MKFWKYLSIVSIGVLMLLALCAARSEYFPHATITTAVITTGSITTVDVNGGTIDGAAIGGAVPSTGAFTTLNATGVSTLPSVVAATADVNGGTIDGATIGAAVPSTGAFTLLQASSDPTTADHVGDRGFNDTRYLRAAANLSDLTDAVAARESTVRDISEVSMCYTRTVTRSTSKEESSMLMMARTMFF